MQRTLPGISVIVPAYNAGTFISEALASIRRQTLAPLEVIVVDDGSTDDTAAQVAAAELDVRYEYQPNQGPAAARNRGLALARGELLAFLDADDVWPTDKLALQMEGLQTAPDAPLVMGHIQFLRKAPGEACFTLEPTAQLAMLVGCLLARREAFERVGGFDPALRMSEDTDWFIRAREVGLAITQVPETVLYYRRHAASLTSGKTSQDLPLAEVLKRSLDRRRQKSEEQPPE